ncbi:unnamed protein product [Prorocentrum cordatum]|uniref:Uncharacterized protein n=1 Tax=Prorocentrum cordatum TaxID=2364126 RepID=A0ABN9TRH1_9DINO|nr:unnamed protein product [Polarella glacialis]
MPLPRPASIDSKYRKLYLVVLCVLGVVAAAFVFGSIMMAVNAHDNPPVQMSVGAWGAFPIFKLCYGPKSSAPNVTTVVAGKIKLLDNVINVTTGTKDGADDIKLTHSEQCAIADLRGFGPARDFNGAAGFFFGITIPKSVHTQNAYASVWYQRDPSENGTRLIWLHVDRAQDYSLEKTVEGWTLGYQTSSIERLSARSVWESEINNFQRGEQQVFDPHAKLGRCWPKKGQATPQRKKNIVCANVILKVYDPMVIQTLKVGIVPQILGILSSVGGLSSVATMFISVLFVKKYARGDVAVAYDSVTLVGTQVDEPVTLDSVPEVRDMFLTPTLASPTPARPSTSARTPTLADEDKASCAKSLLWCCRK